MITIDYQSKIPFYEQIARRFQTLILRGALPPHSQIPSVRTLAMELSINPNTIQKAYALLEQEGYIYPVKGKGNYVADTENLTREKQTAMMEKARSLLTEGRDLGIRKEEYLGLIHELYEEEGTL